MLIFIGCTTMWKCNELYYIQQCYRMHRFLTITDFVGCGNCWRCLSTTCNRYCLCSSWLVIIEYKFWINATPRSAASFTTFIFCTVRQVLLYSSLPFHVHGSCNRKSWLISIATKNFLVSWVINLTTSSEQFNSHSISVSVNITPVNITLSQYHSQSISLSVNISLSQYQAQSISLSLSQYHSQSISLSVNISLDGSTSCSLSVLRAATNFAFSSLDSEESKNAKPKLFIHKWCIIDFDAAFAIGLFTTLQDPCRTER